MRGEVKNFILNTNRENNFKDHYEAEKIKYPPEKMHPIEDMRESTIQKTIQELEDYIEAGPTALNLQLDQNTARLICRVISKDGRVIKKISVKKD